MKKNLPKIEKKVSKNSKKIYFSAFKLTQFHLDKSSHRSLAEMLSFLKGILSKIRLRRKPLRIAEAGRNPAPASPCSDS